eukprot:GDKJ01037196.1.p1 GENE.GDKJ01037196.1~~GDKJ01037196.1.p1  ORF type:complete len:522 (+),score=117.23 GDKJ01037196.1:32-1597(+)
MLTYKVKYASSEEDECPASLLTSNTSGGRGWKSRRFCSYPQELVLQLDNESQITQIQLLSHHSCISTKVELYSANAVNDKVIVNDWSFTRIGYFTLDDNSRSEYRARELKTVYVNVTAKALRIVLHKNFVNSHNRFNQVGISAIAIQGSPVAPVVSSATRVAPLASIPDIAHPSNDLGADIRLASLDAQTKQRIKDLEMLKTRAIAAEDFDEAKRCKAESEKLLNAGVALAKLEERKKAAIANDDFDLAKVIKLEIDRIRAVAMGAIEGEIDPSAPLPSTNAAPSRAAPTRQLQSRAPPPNVSAQPAPPAAVTAAAPRAPPKMNADHSESANLPGSRSGYDLSNLDASAFPPGGLPTAQNTRQPAAKKRAGAPPSAEQPNAVVTTLATEKVGEQSCMFCHLEADDFSTTEGLELHLFGECPTMSECPGCNQVIEVVDMIKHRLEQCPESQIFAPCSVCRLPITDEEAETELHLSCNPPQGTDARGNKLSQCILCTQELPCNSIVRWRKHLTKECPENTRRL